MQIKATILTLAMLTAGLAAVGCGADETPPVGPGPSNAVTYYQHVAPVLNAKCVGCHQEGGIAPFVLDRYDIVSKRAQIIRAVVVDRSMPPWPPGPQTPELRHERKLTEDEIALVTRWVDDGAPAGDADNPAPLPPPDSVALQRADISVDIGVDYAPDTTLKDEYRCFLVDLGTSEDRVAVGFRITPTNRAIAHHSIVTLFERSELAKLQALDAETPDRAGWPCFAGPVPTNANIRSIGRLGAWVPGVDAVLRRPGVGTPVPAGALAVVQMHYNNEGGSGTDRTRLAVQLADKADEPSLQKLQLLPMRNGQLSIPRDQPDVVQEKAQTSKQWAAGRFFPDGEGYLVGVAAHMHLLGTAFRVTLERDGKTQVLLDIPRWDFSWQSQYDFVEPIKVLPDDKLTVRCVYNNTMAHRVAAGASREMRDVSWGEGTNDEMCIGYLDVVDNKPPPLSK
ncbi:MAG: hypothetical protein KC503_35460 [Myxococcales bacterium]|nr:hypothetical protein [Myxococcales bacterium]